ncbi:MAG: hypothetical protein OJF52_000412 [Nitrospira sp.]|jgi:hypothetical protein|nr:MAG: hypothetical protein OJF52_000412 [Nitrospira sp.]
MSRQCIYPGPHSDKFSSEHYLPEAIGRFSGMELLDDRVCRACNTELGKRIETQFARAGSTVFFRWLIGVQGKNGLPPNPFYRRAAGVDPIVMIGRAPGWQYDLLWEIEAGSEDAFPLRQIVFEHSLTGHHPVPLLDRMRGNPEVLNQHLRELGIESAKPIHVIALPDEIPWVEDLVRSLGFELPGNWKMTEFPPQQIQLVVNVNVTAAYFRAVAKIVFHYMLKMFPEFTGHEREFDEIKTFIWDGGEISRFVQQRRDQFVTNFRMGMGPTKWMHVLAVEKGGGSITGYAQFFLGPRALSLPYAVKIGRDPSPILTRPRRRSHMYVIQAANPMQVPEGVMEDATPINHVWIPYF